MLSGIWHTEDDNFVAIFRKHFSDTVDETTIPVYYYDNVEKLFHWPWPSCSFFNFLSMVWTAEQQTKLKLTADCIDGNLIWLPGSIAETGNIAETGSGLYWQKLNLTTN